ncbi:hypothetical protein PENTCL1PPCAC_928 [Pristionchus entomophagus]|uniref:glucuronosyltransferase n=1 Tax=Pristionchus entomophagus TaxID=358040 RepID=A0AAV5S7W3_9BILA|nr:hypothetical protein PENTCL1PPCAC_928 [Pristionchus entomophagus]
MRLLSLFPLLLSCSFSLDILMYVNVVGKSHLQFAEKIIALLAKHGHNVDLALGMLNSGVVVSGNYGARKMVDVHFPGEGSSWGKAVHLTSPFEELSEWNRLTQPPSNFIETSEQLCDHLLNSTEVADIFTSRKYDLALISGYDLCPFGIAHHYKISPVVSFVPTPSFQTQFYYSGHPEIPLYETTMFDASHTDRSEFGVRVFEFLRTAKDRYYHISAHAAINTKLRARFGADFPDVGEIMMQTSLDFSNSHPLLEEPKPISLRLRYIGGVGLPKPKPLSKDLDKMLDRAEKGTVIFSLGTQVKPEVITAELQQVFVNTFKLFPEYNFLWKFDGKTQRNASNIFNFAWLPQTDLLYDSRVVAFISHMGLNSFTETSFAGVPVVSIPLFADQVHNARRAKALGFGEIVRKSEVTEANLVRALEKVLFEERYRNRAKEISRMISATTDNPERIFIDGIEFAAKFKNLSSHYRLAGANHNFLVQMGWDVAAFFTAITILSTYLTIKASVFVLRIIASVVRIKRKME